MGHPSQSYETSPATLDHSITCHTTQVNAPCLNPSQCSIYIPSRDGRLSSAWCWRFTLRCFTCLQSAIQVETTGQWPEWKSNPQTLTHKSVRTNTLLFASPSQLQSTDHSAKWFKSSAETSNQIANHILESQVISTQITKIKYTSIPQMLVCCC